MAGLPTLDLNKSISNILEPYQWLLYDWLMLLTALEVRYNIDILDEWGENLDLTLGELLANLATLEVSLDKSLGFQKVMTLGYLNINLDEEEDGSEDSIMN